MTTTLTVPGVEPNGGGELSRYDAAMYRRIVETANEGIWQLDAEFRAVLVNERMAGMLGYAPEDMVGHSIRDFMLPGEITDYERRSRGYREQGGRDRFERRLRHRDGHTVTVLVSVTPLLDRDGVFQGAFAMLTDITERERAEAALAESEERLRTLINTMPDIVCFKDGEGRWLEANDYDLQLFQLEGVDYRGKKDSELAAFSPFYRDAFLTCEDSDEQAWALARPSRGDEIIPRPDGTARVFDIVKIPTFHPDGRRKGLVVVGRDVTERQRMEAELGASEARFRSIFELSPLGIALVSKSDHRFVHANPRYCELLGYSLEELRRLTVADVTHPDDWSKSQSLFAASSPEQRAVRTLRKRYLRKDGAVRWVNLTAALLPGQTGEEPLAIGIVEDITERREAEERIRHLALHDVLTDLPNRALMEDRLRHAISEAQREETLVALLFLDLDRFKIINDSLGHALGDRLLCVVAERLGHHVRGSDTVCRLGGDEFVIVLTAVSQASDVARVADKLLLDLAQPLLVDDHTLSVSASVGISLYPMDGRDPETLLQHADTALYQAKGCGRNNYQFFTLEMNVRVRERLQLEHSLRQALEHGEFTLYYQPQVDCVTRQVVAVEALLRWRHPELGWVAPDRFVPIAEDIGLIVPIGEWALRQACRDSQAWRRAGLEHGRIALNVSASQLQRVGFDKRLAEILREHDLQPGDLELELTESLLVGEANAASLRQLKDMGVALSIDDFGSGYSSLSCLRRFAIDKLKLDQSFLRDVAASTDAATIVNAIVTIAHCLRLAVVAEGVETRQQVEFLRERNCRLMQGYHFSPPRLAEDLGVWLRQRVRVAETR